MLISVDPEGGNCLEGRQQILQQISLAITQHTFITYLFQVQPLQFLLHSLKSNNQNTLEKHITI